MITVKKIKSGSQYREFDYAVYNCGVEIFHTDNMTEAQYVASWAKMQEA
jgi:hypothetical protein